MADEQKLGELIENATKIVIIQADNPDGDSLGSSIALEQILSLKNKDASMYCAVDIPNHLKYMTGWSRVSKDLPRDFDLSIIVDTSSISLLEKIRDNDLKSIKGRGTVVIDHHQTEATIDFATLLINRPAVATGEIIYDLAKELELELNQEAREALAISILSDSLGLMTTATTSHSIRVIADLVDEGVVLPHIDSLRRETFRKSLELTKYKGELLKRIETYLDNRLAIIVIPWVEIETFSPLYNPPMLVMEDMRMIENNAIVVAIKVYSDGHLTAKIRANDGFPIASKLAEHFGGGGHTYASGIKTTDYSLEDFRRQIVDKVSTLLDENQP